MDEEAVSPVVGVILMVAITVALAAVVMVAVMGMGEDWSEEGDWAMDQPTSGSSECMERAELHRGLAIEAYAAADIAAATGHEVAAVAWASLVDEAECMSALEHALTPLIDATSDPLDDALGGIG